MERMDQDLHLLVEQAQRGDTESFRRLVELHSHAVFRVAFRILADEMAAEDAVQETFLRAYRQLSGFDFRSSFSTWIHRIAVNQAIDLQRHAERRRPEGVLSGLDGPAEPSSSAPQPDRLLASKEVSVATRAALADLSATERAAFVLRHFEGNSIAEISRALGLGDSAAKQAIFRAVKKLRRALEPWVRSAHEAVS